MAIPKKFDRPLRILGYIAFFLFAFLIFVRMTLPTDEAKGLLELKVAEALGADKVTIEKLSLTGLIPNGIKVENVDLGLSSVPVKTLERGVDVPSGTRMLSIENFKVQGSLSKALKGDYEFSFSGSLQGGPIKGGHVQYKPETGAKLSIQEWSDVALGTEGLFLSLTGLDVIGRLSGSLELEIPAIIRNNQPQLAYERIQTKATLAIDDARILKPIIDTTMNGEVMRMGFTDVELGHIELRVNSRNTAQRADSKRIQRGIIDIEELSARDGDLETVASRRSVITTLPSRPLSDGTISLHLAVKINEAWYDKTMPNKDKPGEVNKPNSMIRTMMSMGALQRYTVDDQFGLSITGPLKNPKVALSRPRTRVGTATGESDPGSEQEDDDDDLP